MKAALTVLTLAMALAACQPGSETNPDTQAVSAQPAEQTEEFNMASWQHVTVGVADLDSALDLWVGKLGFEILARSEGSDPGLAQLWSLQPADIARQAIVRTPGEQHGMLHLVQFVDPDPPVRAGAEVYDLVPKNLDIHARDLPARFAELKASGEVFRNDSPSEITTEGGLTFREIHMKGHDDTNIVLLESEGEQLPYSPQGFAGVGPVITIVPSASAEKAFYVDVLGLEILSENILNGPEIERMVGLPPGAGLDVSVLGHEEEHFGRIEIVDYQGVDGTNLYPKARPKALGTLHVSYMSQDLKAVRSRLGLAGVPITEYGQVTTLFGSGQAIAFASPAGMRIEVHQRD